MKAVVMEKQHNECAVLCDDGTFRKIKGNYAVGQEIDYSEAVKNESTLNKKHNVSYTALKYITSISAAAILLLTLGIYNIAFACSYVTLDVNPSIEYTLNRLNRVLSVHALNEDASDIVESLNSSGIKMNSLQDAINLTTEALQSEGYLSEKENAVLIDIVSDSEYRENDLEEKVAATDIYNSEDTSVVCLLSDSTTRSEAAKQGISTGRYEAMMKATSSDNNENQVSDSDDKSNITTYRTIPVKEILNGLGQSLNNDSESESGNVNNPETGSSSIQNSPSPGNENTPSESDSLPDNENAPSQSNALPYNENVPSENKPMPDTEKDISDNSGEQHSNTDKEHFNSSPENIPSDQNPQSGAESPSANNNIQPNTVTPNTNNNPQPETVTPNTNNNPQTEAVTPDTNNSQQSEAVTPGTDNNPQTSNETPNSNINSQPEAIVPSTDNNLQSDMPDNNINHESSPESPASGSEGEPSQVPSQGNDSGNPGPPSLNSSAPESNNQMPPGPSF